MSGIKIDVQWSPIDDDTFIAYGSNISLYQVKETDSDGRPSSPTIHPVDTKPEHQFLKCLAWCPWPDPKNVFAVAQASGKISITGFKKPADDFIGKEFSVRHNRQCNYLAWNPVETKLLAQGLERNRNEPCILIWDVMSTTYVEVADRSRHSISEGPVSKPYAELGSGDTSSSFCWFKDQPNSFITGMTNRHLRLFDLRDPLKPRKETNHRCVNGVCVDPMEDHRIASYNENQIAVWDLRSFDRPVNVISESKAVVKIGWCPTKKGILSILCKDAPAIKLHDIRHSIFGSDEIDQDSTTRNIQPFRKGVLSSFCWHPHHENRLIAVQPSGDVKDVRVFERFKMQWSSGNSLTMSFNKKLLVCVEEDTIDISTVIKARVEKGYGMDPQNVTSNMEAIEKETSLHGMWRWINNVRVISAAQPTSIPGRRRSPHNMGILAVLRLDPDSPTPSVNVSWKGENVRFNARPMYMSKERQLALKICGWTPDELMDNFMAFISRLEKSGEQDKAAAIALFFLHMKLCLDILSGNTMNHRQDTTNLQAVAMALSGYTEDRSALWLQTCKTLCTRLASPYLRAMFAFLAVDNDYEGVLNEVGMSVEDRVAFALVYLPDDKLMSFLNQLSKELIQRGDLDGILLTGMSPDGGGLDLMQRYVDMTWDVQTAAVACIFSGSQEVLRDPRVGEWIAGYRDLLDTWSMWFQRAIFDNVKQQLVKENLPPQVLLRCNFCSNPIPKMGAPTRIQDNRRKTSCPHCNKALPRCAVCLKNMGTHSGSGKCSSKGEKLSPFEEWFTWCQTCRHGGHAKHINKWFSEQSECPVTGCSCKCSQLDSLGQLQQAEIPSWMKASPGLSQLGK